MPIAIDVMGGDFYPHNPVLGAIRAVNERKVDVVLVGDEKAIKGELDLLRFNRKKVDIAHASQVVEMDESVASALRAKKESSIRVCFDLHKRGDVQGVVSAGNSGAMLAVGHFVLKTISGVDRPCISALLPSLKGKVLLVDAGANIESTPNHLSQFAILGSLYMEHIYSITSPRIGLLNIGSEDGKGDERSKKAFSLLRGSSLNFVGNIEGREFFDGDIDVVVSDGFSGNILLKSVQGAADFMRAVLRQESQRTWLDRLGALFMRSALERLDRRTSYSEFGGAPLLGLRGNCVLCHGRSNPEALLHGIGFAKWASDTRLVERMEEKMVDFMATN